MRNNIKWLQKLAKLKTMLVKGDVSYRDKRAACEAYFFEKELEISRLGIQLLAFNLCRNFKNPF